MSELTESRLSIDLKRIAHQLSRLCDQLERMLDIVEQKGLVAVVESPEKR